MLEIRHDILSQVILLNHSFLFARNYFAKIHIFLSPFRKIWDIWDICYIFFIATEQVIVFAWWHALQYAWRVAPIRCVTTTVQPRRYHYLKQCRQVGRSRLAESRACPLWTCNLRVRLFVNFTILNHDKVEKLDKTWQNLTKRKKISRIYMQRCYAVCRSHTDVPYLSGDMASCAPV